ncbi:MAG: hypothetical protein AAF725_24715 [Acidobacteriota bacterium]
MRTHALSATPSRPWLLMLALAAMTLGAYALLGAVGSSDFGGPEGGVSGPGVDFKLPPLRSPAAAADLDARRPPADVSELEVEGSFRGAGGAPAGSPPGEDR